MNMLMKNQETLFICNNKTSLKNNLYKFIVNQFISLATFINLKVILKVILKYYLWTEKLFSRIFGSAFKFHNQFDINLTHFLMKFLSNPRNGHPDSSDHSFESCKSDKLFLSLTTPPRGKESTFAHTANA